MLIYSVQNFYLYVLDLSGSCWLFVGKHGPPRLLPLSHVVSTVACLNFQISMYSLRVLTFVSSPHLTCGVTSGRVFLLWFSITFCVIRPSFYSSFSSARSSSSTVGIVSPLLADLLRPFGLSSTSFLSKYSHYFLAFGECFLWVRILLLCGRSL